MFRILLLEDDPADRELIETTLNHGGVEANINCVVYRQEFIKSLRTDLPDLILADYVLPQFDGISALLLAQKICPDVPFILISGILGEEEAIDALKKGATDYILKACLGRLVPSVERTIKEYRGQQEQQKTAQALREADSFLRAAVEASPVGIVTLNQVQQIVTWNAAAQRMYGWHAEATAGRRLSLVTRAEQAAFDSCFALALQGHTVPDQEFQTVREGQGRLDISLSFAPLHSSNDQVSGVVVTIADITMRKQIEAQRLSLLQQEKTARTAAESANRIKDEFLSILSHELRTPLNAIIGWISLIERGNLNADVMQSALSTIKRNATAQARLVQDLLDLSRIVRGKVKLHIQPADAAKIAHDTVDIFRPAAEAKAIAIETDVADDLAPILADPDRLQQIFNNLLSNAVKFTPPSSRIQVRLSAANGVLRFQVIDTGVGISADFLPYVFDDFRQEDSSSTRPQGGLGLGLSVTRRLVELHGGTITAESPGLGQGATFTVELPIRLVDSCPDVDGSKEPSNSDGFLSLSGVKAIVVDDEADSQEILATILEQYGAQVACANSVQDAYHLLHQFVPDVIISDIGMPDEDGYSFIKILRSRAEPQISAIPAIALTAYAREEDRRRALLAGFESHLAKPFRTAEIVNAVYDLTRNSKSSQPEVLES